MQESRHSTQDQVLFLKKLKHILTQQREKFHHYLLILEAEKTSIENDQMESLEKQLKMEETVILDIQSLQKVIRPLEMVLQQSYPSHQDQEIKPLQTSLENLRQQILEKNKANRHFLSDRMTQVRAEILQLKPQFRVKNPFGSTSEISPLIDITT